MRSNLENNVVYSFKKEVIALVVVYKFTLSRFEDVLLARKIANLFQGFKVDIICEICLLLCVYLLNVCLENWLRVQGTVRGSRFLSRSNNTMVL